ncbi:MAG: tRNA pseudouridine(13) synthase TruD [Phycisphaerae bacterium]|nr:tRNA pseudouridine(13) synthase TruD [Phycisphaerae bacterium]
MSDESKPAPALIPLPPLPYLTADLPGIGGHIKLRPQDFVVTEIPAYDPAGAGTHVYFLIEKTDIDTRTAVVRIAHALGRETRDFGYAGMKDRRAVARQMLSIEHVDPAVIEKLEVPGVRVLNVALHGNKLRLGHLAGNRFDIRIRGVTADQLADTRRILDVLSRRGLPNYFGPQRFGVRGTGHLLGLALLRGDDQEFLDLFLGRPDESIDYGAMLRARKLYTDGKFDDARHAWPGHHREERAALGALVHGRNARRARFAVDKHLRRLFLSALQSFLFNEVVAARLPTIDKVLLGDLAFIHGRGAVFAALDPAVEQPRADSLEISPSGPLYGFKMTWPTGEAEKIERDVVTRNGVDVAWFGQGEHNIRGERRPLRIPLPKATCSSGVDDAGVYIEVSFALPSGAYATVALRELMKSEEGESEESPGASED